MDTRTTPAAAKRPTGPLDAARQAAIDASNGDAIWEAIGLAPRPRKASRRKAKRPTAPRQAVADVDRELRELVTREPKRPAAPAPDPRTALVNERRSAPDDTGLPDLALAAQHGGSPRVRLFLLQIAGTFLLVLAVVALFNRAVDPLGVWKSADSATSLNGDRAKKMQLFDTQKLPDFIMVGASRVQKYNPEVITHIDGKTGFNASVAGTSIQDQLAFVGWAAERAGHHTMPHVIYGIAPEEFRSQPVGGDIMKYPQLARQISGQSPFMQSLQTKWQPLVEWGTVKESWDALWHGGEGGSQASSTGGFTETFAKNGFMTVGYDDHTQRSPSSVAGQHAKTVAEYEGVYTSHAVTESVPPDAAHNFERILQIANAHGDAPTIFLLPTQPSLATKLDALGRLQQNAAVRAYLQGLKSKYRFNWFDYTDIHSFGGNAADWYDGAHPMAPIGTAVMQQLVKDSRAQHSRAL